MSGMKSRLSVWKGIYIAVLPICMFLAQANGKWQMTTSNSSWDKACFDNGPAVIDGIQFYPMKFPQNMNLSSIIGGVRVWIGYYQTFDYFNLLGCLPTQGERNLSMIGNTPGRCAMACSSFNYIGLEDNTCHCLNFTGKGPTQLQNSATCPIQMCNGTNFICGTRGQMWVYGVNIGNTSYFDELAKKFDNANKCISASYSRWSGGVVWKFTSCFERHKSLCELNDTTLDFSTYRLSSLESWNEAARTCFNKSEIPARFEFGNWRRYNLVDFNEAWTAYIRDETIQKKGSESSPQGRIKCLSLSVSEGQPELHFEDCQYKLPSVCLAGITTTTTMLTTTTAVSAAGRITSIASTTSSPVKTSVSSEMASSLPTTSTSSTRPFSDTKTPTSSELQSTSRKTYAPLTSIRSSQSSSSSPTYSAKESTFTNNDFPMYGRIGLGILLVLVTAGIFLVIQRCKMKGIDKEIPLSSPTSVDPSDHIDKLFSGIAISDIDENEVRTIEDENEMHNTDKDNRNDWPQPGDPRNDWDIQPNPNYDSVQINGNAQNSNDLQKYGTVPIDNTNTTSNGYATVDIANKSSSKIIETRQESDSSTYDLTYVRTQEGRNAGSDYYHIYDHANLKNPPNRAEYEGSDAMGQQHGRNRDNHGNVIPFDSNWMFKSN